jgi:DsbC/DsbD-like thiol-disulfide interchange protein
MQTFSWSKDKGNFTVRLIAASLLLLPSTLAASAGGPRTVVSARTLLATNAVHPGQTARLAVLARIEPGYHINDHKPSLDYLIPTKVEFETPPSMKVEKVVYPHGKQVKFDFLDSPISVYEGEIRLGSVLKVDGSVKPGTYHLRGKFMYQACNDSACLPPASVPFEASVRVAPASVPLKPANSEIFKTINFK